MLCVSLVGTSLDKHLTSSSSSSLGIIQASLVLLLLRSSVDFVFLLLTRHNTSKLDSALVRSSVLASEAVKYGFFDFHLLFIISSQISLYLGDLADYNLNPSYFFKISCLIRCAFFSFLRIR